MTRDIRSAGHGADLIYLESAAARDRVRGTARRSSGARTSAVAGHAERAAPVAAGVQPVGFAEVHPPDGTHLGAAWRSTAPAPVFVRYTLDVNNDGAVDASDISAGADARMT